MSNPPQLPSQGSEGQGHFNISGSGNVLNFGGNIQQQHHHTSVSHWYTTHMAAHGSVYWLLHVVVALAAVAIWEYGPRFLHFVFSFLR
jgi:hypothetical protein